MAEWFFYVTFFGFMLALDPSSPFHLLSSSQSLRRAAFSDFLNEGVTLGMHLIILFLGYSLLKGYGLPQSGPALPSLFFLIGAYGLRGLNRRSDLFFLLVFGVAVFLLSRADAFGPWEFVVFFTGTVFGILFFKFMLLGMGERLRFCRIPSFMEGLPALFLTAALGALVLGGLIP